MDEINENQSFAEEEISLMRELLHMLVYEEKCLISHNEQMRTQVAKQRFAIRRKINILRNHTDNNLIEEDQQYLTSIQEALSNEIQEQKKRNLHLLKHKKINEPIKLKTPSIQTKLTVIDPTSFYEESY